MQAVLCRDEITIGMLLDRIHEEDCKTDIVLDGFPRTIPQAESLTQKLWTTWVGPLTMQSTWMFPDENIINRMSGRRACLSCGGNISYSYTTPLKEEGICDVCGQQLVLRDDDKPGNC